MNTILLPLFQDLPLHLAIHWLIVIITGILAPGTSIQRYQVIRIPRYYDFTIKTGASVTCPSWNGNTGGIVGVDVANTFTLNGTIDVSYKGFRGGGGKNLTGATRWK